MDIVNNQAAFVASRAVLDAIPTATLDTPSRALLIPGTTVTPYVLGQFNLTVHGSSTSDFTIAIDGLRVNNLCGSGQYSGFYMNDGSVQELTYSTGSESAEIQSSGIRVNTVPKDGGNRFSGSFFAFAAGQRPAGRQPVGRGKSDSVERPAADLDRRHGVRLSVQSVVRRPARERQALVLRDLQVRERQDLRPEREVSGRQPGVPERDGQLQRRRPDHVGRDEQGPDPRLRREAVQR